LQLRLPSESAARVDRCRHEPAQGSHDGSSAPAATFQVTANANPARPRRPPGPIRKLAGSDRPDPVSDPPHAEKCLPQKSRTQMHRNADRTAARGRGHADPPSPPPRHRMRMRRRYSPRYRLWPSLRPRPVRRLRPHRRARSPPRVGLKCLRMRPFRARREPPETQRRGAAAEYPPFPRAPSQVRANPRQGQRGTQP